MANVLFKFGTREAFNAVEKLSNAVYFVTDTGELYKGETLIANKNVVSTLETPVGDSITPAQAHEAQIAAAPITGEVMVVPRTDGTQDTFIYDGADWIQLDSNVDADDVIVGKDPDTGDPITLADALQNLNVQVDGVSIVRDATVGLMLKDYGKAFYKFNEATQTYEKTTVSDQNPWKANLSPRVVNDNGSLVLGWFEPAAADTSLDDIVSKLAELDETINGKYDPQEDARTPGLVDRVADLEDLIGSAFHFEGTADTFEEGNLVITGTGGAENIIIAPSADNKGAVYQVGDKEYASNGEEWVELGFSFSGVATDDDLQALADRVDAAEGDIDQLQSDLPALDGAAVKSINVPGAAGGVNSLEPVNGVVTLPAASDSAYGLIKLSGEAGKVLDGTGAFVDPQDPRIGDLTDENSTPYDTVEEYVQHYVNNLTNIINNMSIEWEEVTAG